MDSNPQLFPPSLILQPSSKAIFVGKCESGKTTLLVMLLYRYCIPKGIYKPENIYIISSSFWVDNQFWPLWEVVSPHHVFQDCEEATISYLNKCLEFRPNTQDAAIIIMDDMGYLDLARSKKRFEEYNKLYITAHKWLNCSIVTIIQSINMASTIMLDQGNVIILFKTNNIKTIDKFYERWGIGTKNEFRRLFLEATAPNKAWLMIREDKVSGNYHYFSRLEKIALEQYTRWHPTELPLLNYNGVDS